ncbi:hypothetical protein BJ322DRAFT_1170948 [Thelephora terrestris]|uniref:Uncharacterized protein n=1 Tax=Thelephora terrestris TaxID=56493 RepID=A0A9P6HMW0_9AGAM|nr:hypothetical protein BJ322DRAFT_1170905 [Thelephora terrestris]KAF9791005.1 hypothetical protein BJ322DRAFT_1170948 [Thelephora terrestris]
MSRADITPASYRRTLPNRLLGWLGPSDNIYLRGNQAAVESARETGNTQVWKQVHAACIGKKPKSVDLTSSFEQLNILISTYERRGRFDEIPSLLEAGLSLERAHIHRTLHLLRQVQARKVDGAPKAFRHSYQHSKVIRAAEKAHLWPEPVLLCAKA